MARADPTIYIRIPQELKDMLDAAALENRTSLTSEVVRRLTASFDAPALGFGKGSRAEEFEQARQEVLAKMEASVPVLADKVWQLIAERMNAGKK